MIGIGNTAVSKKTQRHRHLNKQTLTEIKSRIYFLLRLNYKTKSSSGCRGKIQEFYEGGA